MKKVIAVLGGGSFGTAMAVVLSEKNLVRIWLRNKRRARKVRKIRENKEYLPGVKIPESVFISHNLKEVLEGADLIILAVPSFGVRDVLQSVKKVSEATGADLSFLPPLLGLSKGMEKNTLKFPSEIVEDVCRAGNVPYFHLAGAGFAKDIAAGKKVVEILASAGAKKDLALQLQQILATPQFQIILSDDLIGVQVGGALKNILAIAAAMIEEFSGEDREVKNKLFSLCLQELIRVGTALGSSQEALSSAKNDLLLTAGEGSLSRNYKIGKMIVREGIPKLRKEIKKQKLTSEGISSAEAIYQICSDRGIEAPIIKEIALIVSQRQTPEQAARNLIDLTKRA